MYFKRIEIFAGKKSHAKFTSYNGTWPMSSLHEARDSPVAVLYEELLQ
jgi:hypothetical protein